MRELVVIDGQGGGVGRSIVTALRAELGDQAEIVALGTNSTATVAMHRAGATRSATGENAIRIGCSRASVIVGTIGIISPHAMMGELTPPMAEAVALAAAPKVLIPLNRCNLLVAGCAAPTLASAIAEGVAMAARLYREQNETMY